MQQADTAVAKIAAGIAQIHERWDGSVSRSKSGDAINLNARILSITSHYDASHQRSYRDAQDAEEAADYLLKHSGQFFDPELLDLC